MAKNKKTAGLLDDIFDFGFGLKYDNEMIDQAENIIGKDKEDMSPEERDKFRKILEDLLKKKEKETKLLPQEKEVVWLQKHQKETRL